MEALTTLSEVLALTPRAAFVDVPVNVVNTAVHHPVSALAVGGGLGSAMHFWDKFRPQLAQRFTRWQGRIPALGPVIMTAGLFHAATESLRVARAIPAGASYDTVDFRLPFGTALVTGFFLSLAVGIEFYARRLERRLKTETESENSNSEPQKLAQRARSVQKMAAYLCIADDVVPIMVFFHAMV